MESFLVLLVLLSFSNAEDTLDKNCKIGFGFYLPRHNLFGNFREGAKLYEPFEYNKCIVSVARNEDHSDVVHYPDVTSFFKMVSSRAGIPNGLQSKFTLGTTFNEQSSAIASDTYQASGASLYIHTHIRDEVISAECQKTLKLDQKFASQFEKLPLEVEKPEFRSSWSEYENFLKTFGSHFASRTSFGARLEQWNFAKDSKRYSEAQLKARACADFLGPKNYRDLNLKICNNFGSKEILDSTKLEVSSKFTLLGSTHEARTALLLGRSVANMKQFLDAATDNTEISYRFTGVWDLLKKRYSGTEHFAKALNLEYFYKGFLDRECNFLKSTRSSQVLRRFTRSDKYSTAKPAYKCEMPPRGCNSNSDCHLGGPGDTWAVCYCYGDSCIDHRVTRVGNRNVQQAYSKFEYDHQSHWVGTHYSCDYNVGVWCSCNKAWGGGWKTMWSSESPDC